MNKKKKSLNSPCFQIAELLRDHLPEVDAEAVHDARRQIRMGRAGEDLDVRHSGLQELLLRTTAAAVEEAARLLQVVPDETSGANRV